MENYKNKRIYIYLIILSIAGSFGLQGWRTLFNNYGVDNIGINGIQVGIIQSIRELPGFLSLLVGFLLFFIKEHKLSAVSMVVVGIGVSMVPLLPSFYGLIFTTFLFSLGFHFFETTNNSLTLQYFDEKTAPIVLAKEKSWKSLTNIFVGILLMVLSYFVSIKYNFFIIGIPVILVGLFALRFNPVSEKVEEQKKGILVKKEYWLFYVINILSGARRQIFVVFSVFLMVEKFNFTVRDVTIMFLINNVITYFLSPVIARMIIKFGEKKLLSIEYFSMFFVFLGYAFFDNAILVAGLYILDNIFYNCAMGINTYFQKIAKKEDIAPSMAFGFTMNHVAAIIIPFIGGALWMLDYKIPFLIAAVLSLLSLFFVRKIKYPLKTTYK